MSSSRLIYDKCAYAVEIKESTSSLDYNLYKGKYENGKQCPIGDYANNICFGVRAVMENELYGLSRPGSLCPCNKYNPNEEFKIAQLSPPRICENIYYITPNNIEKPKSTMLRNIEKTLSC